MTDLLQRITAGDKTRVERAKPVAPEPGQTFLRGPVPWAWIARASRLSGSALRVGLVLFLEQGFRSSPIVKVSTGRLRELGVSRKAVYRAIDLLARHGLLEVQDRGRGRQFVVRLLPAPAEDA